MAAAQRAAARRCRGRSRAPGRCMLLLLCALGCCTPGDASLLSSWSLAFTHRAAWHHAAAGAARRLQQQLQPQQQQQARRPAPPPGGAASSSSSSSAPAAGGLPMCSWNDVKEYCSPSHHVYLSLTAAPATVLHRAATMSYDRNLVCNGRRDEAACLADTANRCFFWNKSCVGLDAYELVNWMGSLNQVTGNAALTVFACPGTDAAQLKACKSATDAGAKGICNQLPGCTFVPLVKECMPTALDGKSVAEVAAIITAYTGAETAAWGACPGACYVQQAAVCQRAYNSSSACKAKPFCVWEYDAFDKHDVCMHRDTAARGADAFSKQLAAIKDKCAALKSQGACEAPKVTVRNVGKFRAGRQQNQGAPQVADESGGRCQL